METQSGEEFTGGTFRVGEECEHVNRIGQLLSVPMERHIIAERDEMLASTSPTKCNLPALEQPARAISGWPLWFSKLEKRDLERRDTRPPSTTSALVQPAGPGRCC